MTAPRITLIAAASLTLLAAMAPPWAYGAASAWSVNDPSQVRLITAAKVAPTAGEMWMGLQFRLKPGWHVYWKNSGDAGYPPAVTFQPEDILGKPELLWPAPQRFDLAGGLVAFGYEKEVIYPIRARLQPAAAPAPAPTPAPEGTPGPPAAGGSPNTLPNILKITADLDYLVCQADCIPFRYTLTLDQPVGIPALPDPETAPLLQSALERLPKPVGEIAGVTTEVALDASPSALPDLEIRVRGVRADAKTDLFLESNDALEAGRPRMKIVSNGVVFHVAMKPKEANKPLPAHTPIAWTVTHLDAKGHPFSLEARRDVEVSGGVGGPPAGGAPPASRERLARLLLSAFLGGALLNLMPPVLALLLAELFVLRAGERGKVREGAAAAATGIVGAAWLVALLAVAAHRAGLPAGWGALLQEPVLVAFLAVLSAVVALNLWGVVEVPLASPDSAGTSGTSRHLLAGLVAMPLAQAWPVPQLREPVSYALGRGPATVTSVFAVAGFGLALPYLLLAVVPVLLRILPAPGVTGGAGAWLPRLREGLGFLAGAGALWVLYALSHQVSAEGIAFIELALLAMSLLAWLRHREGSGRAFRAVLAVGLLACAAGALWLADHNRLVPRLRSAATLPTTQTIEPNPSTPGGKNDA
jgi:DsbC/DsbD-like thiol-disulfide interchange protein